MKNKSLFTAAMLTMMLSATSCMKVLYQVFEVKPSTEGMTSENMSYENEDLSVSYDLWSQGGLVRFTIRNKSDKPIYLDWDRSHFIMNGYSREYYGDMMVDLNTTTNSVITKNKNVIGPKLKFKVSASGSSQLGQRVKQRVELPPNSYITVADFNVSEDVVADCELKIKMMKKNASKDYTQENSPLQFRNYLTYFGSAAGGEAKVVDNNFYVARITSMKAKEFNGKIVSAKEQCVICPGAIKARATYVSSPHKKASNFYALCGKMK